MELLVSAFQGRVVDAIAEQEKVNRILEPDPGAAGRAAGVAGLAEGGAEGRSEGRFDGAAEAGPRLPNKDYYEEILRILKSRNQ